MEAQADGCAIGHRRLASDQSSSSISHSILSSASMASPPLVSVQASSNGLSIPSLLHPQSNDGYGHGQRSSAFEYASRTPFPMYSSSISSGDDFMYSSPESSQSPLSDHYGFAHRSSISSTSSVVDFVPPHCSSPLMNSTASGWAPVLPPSTLPTSCTPLDDEMGSFASVCRFSLCPSKSSSHTDLSPLSLSVTSLPIFITQLDGPERPLLQRKLEPTPGHVKSNHSGLAISNPVRTLPWTHQNTHTKE
jgi:hypothetical protein